MQYTTYQVLSPSPDTLHSLMSVLASLVHGQTLHHLLHHRVLKVLLLCCLPFGLSTDGTQFVALESAVLQKKCRVVELIVTIFSLVLTVVALANACSVS